jgi:hypothetical protein
VDEVPANSAERRGNGARTRTPPATPGADAVHAPQLGHVVSAMVFKGGNNVALAKGFVRFLVGEGWLAHYLDFSAERFLPAMSALINRSI